MEHSKILQLALTGLLIASLPLSVVWAAKGGDKYRKLIVVTLFLTFDLIIFGAFTRLSDSGLGCPDWPGCYGHANPLQAHEQIQAAQAVMPDGPVTVSKAWIEMIHRFFAMAIGVLIIAIVIASWRLWRQQKKAEHAPPLAFSLLFFVCVQGAFGAWTVTLKLQPLIVTIHLLLGMLLLAMIAWLAARQSPQLQVKTSTRLVWLARAAIAVAFVQIGLGGWVSTNYATLACLDYPLCQGSVLPEMDWQHGFTLWRELGKTAAGDYLPFAALTAIHWLHRNMALLVLVVIGALAWQVRFIQPKLSRYLVLILGWQVLTGVATIFLKWPLAIALAHNAGAAALVLVLSMLNYLVRPR